MKDIIRLFNREGAKITLVKVKDLDSENSEWKLVVDNKHSYCLRYVRYIYSEDETIYALDPSGGPFISVGSIYEDNYQIIKIYNVMSIIIRERNNKN